MEPAQAAEVTMMLELLMLLGLVAAGAGLLLLFSVVMLLALRTAP